MLNLENYMMVKVTDSQGNPMPDKTPGHLCNSTYVVGRHWRFEVREIQNKYLEMITKRPVVIYSLDIQ